MSDQLTPTCAFADMGLPEPLMTALAELGFDIPTPIQEAVIPLLVSGKDAVGQAQTGTGKTAAFALPALSCMDPALLAPQVLVLTPTRELAIQVATVMGQLAKHMKGVRVLPVYGGQGFTDQLCALKRGVHIVVGTPGRVMDHMRRETLKLGNLKFMVLDEADEMLRMGFIEDIEWILEQTPDNRQTALFSATMPAPIMKIARKYLKDPSEISIRTATTTADNIRHRYWIANNQFKFEALTRILETESHDGVLIFVKTKTATVEIAEGLQSCGIPSGALNGDMKQTDRERIVNRFKEGRLDILVATDVAARGLDVDRISHVINYDAPFDTESYVHRVGRTGRAGRSGEAIILATPREKRFLADIERATRQTLEPLTMPGVEDVNRNRIEKFKSRITAAMETGESLELFAEIVEAYQKERDVPMLTVAAALARAMHGTKPLLLDRMPEPPRRSRDDSWSVVRQPMPSGRSESLRPQVGRERPFTNERQAPPSHQSPNRPRAAQATDDRPGWTPQSFAASPDRERPQQRQERNIPIDDSRNQEPPERRPERRPDIDANETREPHRQMEDRGPKPGMDRYRLDCGLAHGTKVGNIVGAIANEAGLDGSDITNVRIHDNYSTVDLPEGMPDRVYSRLKKARVSGRSLDIRLLLKGRSTKMTSNRPVARSAGDARPKRR